MSILDDLPPLPERLRPAPDLHLRFPPVLAARNPTRLDDLLLWIIGITSVCRARQMLLDLGDKIEAGTHVEMLQMLDQRAAIELRRQA